MFNIFKKKTEAEKLQVEYQRLMEQSYKLSTTNRSASDQKVAEAEDVLKKIQALQQ